MTRRFPAVARLWREALRAAHVVAHLDAARACGDVARDLPPGSLAADLADLEARAHLCRARAWQAVERGEAETARVYLNGARHLARTLRATEAAQ